MKKDYLKYYFLEDYLFNDIKRSFQEKGYLTSQEFFCIVIWKANRAKSKILHRLLSRRNGLGNVIKEISSEIAVAPNKYERLRILLEKWQFRLPMASAILTVLYPDDFTIYDVRVCKELNIKDFSNKKSCINDYFKIFLPGVKGVKKNKTLRENDRYLWGRSFYYDLMNFLKTATVKR